MVSSILHSTCTSLSLLGKQQRSPKHPLPIDRVIASALCAPLEVLAPGANTAANATTNATTNATNATTTSTTAVSTTGTFTTVTSINGTLNVAPSSVLAAHALFEAATAFPTLLRQWFLSLNRSDAASVSSYFAKYITPVVVLKERRKLQVSQSHHLQQEEENTVDVRVKKSNGGDGGDGGDGDSSGPRNPFDDEDDEDEEDALVVEFDVVTREVIAKYKKGECRLEIGIVRGFIVVLLVSSCSGCV